MRKLFLLLLILIPSLCLGQSITAKHRAVIAAMSGDGVSCDAANDYVGSKTTQSNGSDVTSGLIACWKYTAVCAGTVDCNLKTAHLSHHGTAAG